MFADDSFLFFRACIHEAQNIKSILDNYASHSGQSINYSKSGITFSSNVKVDNQAAISSILGVNNDLQNSKYLGLPSLVGRSKKRVFGFVKERMWKRLQGWKAKKISRAGKTVLIKNVATAIPSYCMSSFLLPRSMCNEMEVLMNKYWWQSGSTDRRGINWVKWSGLSMSKCFGGLAFRDLYGYNIALMAKHVWNFVYSPQSLVSRFYKSKYFQNTHILQAKASPGSSFIWQGIITARNEVLKGYRWILGDGNSINCTQDPWLIGKGDFKVDQTRAYADNNMVVSQLFLQGERKWDAHKVVSIFSNSDANLILSMRIPDLPSMDRLAWAHSTNGKYSVKTGYHLWHNHHVGFGSVVQSKGWTRLWKLDLPHKTKLFLWRFCRNNIPVKSRLSTKGVHIPVDCPMCTSEVEDLRHLFFQCPFALACWSYYGAAYAMSTEDSASGWLLFKLDTCSSEEILLIVTVLWGIWFFRNKKVWENKRVTADIAMSWSAKTISDWKEARDKHAAQVVSKLSVRISPTVKWKKPDYGVYKLNVDAAIKLGEISFSMGLVLRDHSGTLVAGKTICKLMVSSVFEAEATAILEGLQWLINMTVDKVIIESDSFLSVKALQNSQENLLEVGNILSACRSILDSRPEFSVSFVKRQANRVAHVAARIPCSLNCQNIFSTPPSLLLEPLLYDLSY